MPRSFTFRNAIAAITMAFAALCGGGKAVAEQKGTLSVVEIRGNAALRPDARKRMADASPVLRSVSAEGRDERQDLVEAKPDTAFARLVFHHTRAVGLRLLPAPFHSLCRAKRCVLPPVRAPPSGCHTGLNASPECA